MYVHLTLTAPKAKDRRKARETMDTSTISRQEFPERKKRRKEKEKGPWREGAAKHRTTKKGHAEEEEEKRGVGREKAKEKTTRRDVSRSTFLSRQRRMPQMCIVYEMSENQAPALMERDRQKDQREEEED